MKDKCHPFTFFHRFLHKMGYFMLIVGTKELDEKFHLFSFDRY